MQKCINWPWKNTVLVNLEPLPNLGNLQSSWLCIKCGDGFFLNFGTGVGKNETTLKLN